MVYASATFVDSNGTELSSHDSSWVYTNGDGDEFEIQNNRVTWNGDQDGNDDGVEWNADSFGADQVSEVVWGNVVTSEVGALGALTRGGGASSGDYYGVYIKNQSGAVYADLFYLTSGSWQDILDSNDAIVAMANGESLFLLSVGNALLPMQDNASGVPAILGDIGGGSALPGQVVTFHSSGQPGMSQWDNGETAQATGLSSWNATDLQYAVPTSEVSSSWTGTYTAINEAATAIDTTGITITNPNNDAALFAIGSLTDPAVSTHHYVVARIIHSGGGRTCSLQMDLVEDPSGTPTDRASYTLSGIEGVFGNGGDGVIGFGLTGTQIDSITDYTNLGIRLTADSGGGSTTTLTVAWLAFVIQTAVAQPASLPPHITRYPGANRRLHVA